MAKLIGQSPNQVPTNADLGTMAYQDKDNLQVGNVEAKGTINFTDNVGVDRLHISGGGGGAVFNHNDNSPFKFQFSGGTEVFRIESGGNVGIGTASPNQKLHVYHQSTDTYAGIAQFEHYDTDDSTLRYSARLGAGGNTFFKTFVTSSTPDVLIVDQDNTEGRLSFQVKGNAGSTDSFAVDCTGRVEVRSGKLRLDGNDIGGTEVTIADDAVASITPPRNGGFMAIILNGNSAFPQQGHQAMLRYDVGSSLSIDETAIGGGSIDTTTSDVSGTTGTDGNTTVAVQSGVIKIENRSGSSGTYQVTFL
jgi:hypothetical protein